MNITAESTEKQDYRKNSSIDSPSIIVEHFPLENTKPSERCITSQYIFLLSYMPRSICLAKENHLTKMVKGIIHH